MKLTFYGGVDMVTGSNFLLEDDQGGNTLKILVDCGLAQGTAEAEARNWEQFPYDPASIDFLVVTHVHIDHIGRIPKLVREGFHGQILSTEATRALAEPMLQDSAALLKMAAEKNGREILYTDKDITTALKLWRGVFYHEPVSLPHGLMLQFLRAGHILGAAMAEFFRNNKTIIFSGDLGGHSALLDPAESPKGADYLVLESVYGDRTHNEQEKHIDMLQKIIADTAARGGTLLIPAFSTERTQDILFDIRVLMTAKKVPPLPVFLDSPLAITMTHAFLEHAKYFKPEIAGRIEQGENIFSFPELHMVEQTEESHHIAGHAGPKIILAGSGMSAGGRVLAHEKNILPDQNSTLCVVGYQSAGSIGRRLLDGERKVRIMGEWTPVRARVEHIFSYSAHMDSPELMEFASRGAQTLKEIFVVMGEPASSAFLAQRLRDYAGLNALLPQVGESVEIGL